MYPDAEARRIWVAGRPIDIWENPQDSFGWTMHDIHAYARAEHWERLFNALVLLGDSEPKGMA